MSFRTMSFSWMETTFFMHYTLRWIFSDDSTSELKSRHLISNTNYTTNMPPWAHQKQIYNLLGHFWYAPNRPQAINNHLMTRYCSYCHVNYIAHHIVLHPLNTWWRHQMETFSASLALSAGDSPVPGEFPAQRPGTRSFDVFFDLRPNKRLSKQSPRW